jgi:hypothetical protein
MMINKLNVSDQIQSAHVAPHARRERTGAVMRILRALAAIDATDVTELTRAALLLCPSRPRILCVTSRRGLIERQKPLAGLTFASSRRRNSL